MSRGEDKRLRATIVLLGALAVEIYWLKFRVVPDFMDVYDISRIPFTTKLAFGSTPYLVAGSLAPLALILAIRGADGHPRAGMAGSVLAAVLAAGLGVFVIGALYAPIYEINSAVAQ